LNHGGRGVVVGEDLVVGAAVLLPAGDVGDKHAGADDVAHLGSELGQDVPDDLEAALRLLVGVGRDDLPVQPDPRRPGDEAVRSPPAPTQIAPLPPPRGAAVGALALHPSLLPEVRSRAESTAARPRPPARRRSRPPPAPGPPPRA